jgi:hypothetical protein
MSPRHRRPAARSWCTRLLNCELEFISCWLVDLVIEETHILQVASVYSVQAATRNFENMSKWILSSISGFLLWSGLIFPASAISLHRTKWDFRGNAVVRAHRLSSISLRAADDERAEILGRLESIVTEFSLPKPKDCKFYCGCLGE